ncbi:MAG: hypothetical protein KF859_06625 [Phycisphaeraceae bacterium]|nr:hypothetical protein [Phycisphaeraceae bacterium]
MLRLRAWVKPAAEEARRSWFNVRDSAFGGAGAENEGWGRIEVVEVPSISVAPGAWYSWIVPRRQCGWRDVDAA